MAHGPGAAELWFGLELTQLCGGLKCGISDLGSQEPISPSLQVSRSLAANGCKKPVVKAQKLACWIVMSFDTQSALRENLDVEGKEKNVLKRLFFVLCGRREGGVWLRGWDVSPLWGPR